MFFTYEGARVLMRELEGKDSNGYINPCYIGLLYEVHGGLTMSYAEPWDAITYQDSEGKLKSFDGDPFYQRYFVGEGSGSGAAQNIMSEASNVLNQPYTSENTGDIMFCEASKDWPLAITHIAFFRQKTGGTPYIVAPLLFPKYVKEESIPMFRKGTFKLTLDRMVETMGTVKFEANGGTGTMNDVTHNGVYYVPECAFTAPEGYEFECWAANDPEEGQHIKVKDTLLISKENSYTLYALWKEIQPEEA